MCQTVICRYGGIQCRVRFGILFSSILIPTFGAKIVKAENIDEITIFQINGIITVCAERLCCVCAYCLVFPCSFVSKVSSSDYFVCVCVLKGCIALGLSYWNNVWTTWILYAARFSKFKMSSDLYIIVFPLTDFSYRQLHQTLSVKLLV